MPTESLSYFIPLVSGLATLLLGMLTFVQGKKRLENRVFFVFSIASSVWLFGSAFMLASCSSGEKALLIDRLTYLAVIAIPPTVFHFTSTFTRVRAHFLVVVGYMLMIGFWLVSQSPIFVDGLYYYSFGCHAQARLWHHIFLLYFALYISGVFVCIRIALNRERDHEHKAQLRFLFWSLLSLAVIGTTAFLPAYQINAFQLSYFSGLISALILVYGMYRHNLLGLKIIAVELFAIIISIISLVQIFFTESRLHSIVNIFVFLTVSLFSYLMVRGTLREIANRQKNEQLARYLANANARLRELDRQKTEFVSIASHQLRAPVAAIRGYTSLMEDGTYGEVPKTLTEPLGRVTESGRRLALMIDDFLNVSRIEQGRMAYHTERLNLDTLVDTVYEEQRLSADKKGIELTYVRSTEPAVFVMGDEGKLKQILSNLVDNAIKYTPKGSVTIQVRRLDEHRSAMIEIHDTGIGIALDEQELLFLKFKRASNANEANVYGTGLGLYIAKEIIRAHNGWIHVASPGVGKGSTFSIELPYAPLPKS